MSRTGILDHAHASWLGLRGYRRHHVKTSAGTVHALSAAGRTSGPPVVVLHGLAAAAHHYEVILDAARSFSSYVIGVDMLGHGFSARPDVPSFEALEAALVESIDHILTQEVGATPAVIFGNSLGGAAAVRYGSTRPERTRALFLVAPGGAPMDERERAELLKRFAFDTHGDALKFVDGLFDKPHAFRQLIAWGTRRRFGDRSVRSLLSAHAADNFLSAEELRGLPMPIRLLWGDADRILPVSHLDFFRANLPPHAVIDQIPHFGHVPHIDRPSEVVARFRSFVGTLPPHARPVVALDGRPSSPR